MKKGVFAVFAVLLLTLLSDRSQGGPQEKSASPTRTLKVKLHYKGSGTVKDKHKIFVFLFDSPEFMQGQAQPIMGSAATGKDETVTFSDFTASPVYVAVVYDPNENSNYDGQSAPPPGASLGFYSKTPGVPEPAAVEAGKSVAVELTFDDSHQMPH